MSTRFDNTLYIDEFTSHKRLRLLEQSQLKYILELQTDINSTVIIAICARIQSRFEPLKVTAKNGPILINYLTSACSLLTSVGTLSSQPSSPMNVIRSARTFAAMPTSIICMVEKGKLSLSSCTFVT